MWNQPPPEPARFASSKAVVANAFEQFRVPEALTISECAIKYRFLDNPGGGYSGPWVFDQVPYLRRPMDCLSPTSGYSLVGVMGPAQSAKSEIGNNWQLHTAICDPADMIFVGPDKGTVRDYVTTQINKMVLLAPELRSRLLNRPNADNIFSKQFQGCTFFFVWPVAAQMRARPVPKVRVDDFDALPEDIDGEGDALMLLSGRQTTFEGYEMTYVNSSPVLGANRGIEKVIAAGTDERFNVPCLHCERYMELDFNEHLKFEDKGSPEDAKTSAVVVCDACGGIHEQKDKAEMMARGVWAGPEQTVQPDGEVTGQLRNTSSATFRIDGLMGFASWGRLAELHRQAELTFETTQDEGELRAFFNARAGKNYISRLAGAEPVKPEELVARALASDYRKGTVPDGVIALTAAVDIQGNRFEVLVKGWGLGIESWSIDRFPVLALEDGTEKIDPARKPEHWRVLLNKVIWRRYPLESDPEKSIPILNTAIDTGGIDGVTNNAFHFWHTAIRLGVPPTALTLIKGGNNPRSRLLPPPTVDAKRQLKGAPEAELYIPNVNRIKDMIDVRLRREEPGPGYYHLPVDMDPAHIAEMTAEIKQDGIWQRPRGVANETLDLEVYSNVPLLRFGGTDTSLSWVPAWARPQRKQPVDDSSEPTPAAQRKPSRRPSIRTRGA